MRKTIRKTDQIISHSVKSLFHNLMNKVLQYFFRGQMVNFPFMCNFWKRKQTLRVESGQYILVPNCCWVSCSRGQGCVVHMA
jgi:hypothetical protein